MEASTAARPSRATSRGGLLPQTVMLTAAAAMAASAAASCLERRGEAELGSNPCASCHGSASRAGDPLTQAAPPVDVDGNVDRTAIGVGAHQVHLVATARHAAVPCIECHIVPEANHSEGHIDSALPAEVIFGPLASLDERQPAYDPALHTCTDTWCHGPSPPDPRPSPEWTAAIGLDCTGCHGIPPPAPHPDSDLCHLCHSSIDEAQSFPDPALHINGIIEPRQ